MAIERGEKGYLDPKAKVILINLKCQENLGKTAGVLSHGNANHNPRYMNKLGVKTEDWMKLWVEIGF